MTRLRRRLRRASPLALLAIASCAAPGERVPGCARADVVHEYLADVYGEAELSARDGAWLWGNRATGSWTILVAPEGRPELRCVVSAGVERRGGRT